MSEYEIREYDMKDSTGLFLQSWSVKTKEQRGCVLITHGLSEHSDCYDLTAKALAQEGWLVYGWDLQGHGRSPGKRGYIKDFQQFSKDLIKVIKQVKGDQSTPSQNFHLFGHSMGGLITLEALCGEEAPKVQSVILSNPALALALPVPKLKEMVSHWISQFWPTLTLHNEISYPLLSRDPQMVESYKKDSLRHSKISAPLYLGMVQAMEEVKRRKQSIQVPLFFQISGQDQVVAPQGGASLL